MYSSLQKIDIVATSPTGPLYVQTDHRDAAEIAADPELSTLFAIARVLKARAYGASQGLADAAVQYACMSSDVPDFFVEVLAAVGARLSRGSAKDGQILAPVAVTAVELADRAFRELAARCGRRTGSTDHAVVLQAIETETLAEAPDPEADELSYWTRVLELAAVTGELVRGKRGGTWQTLSDNKLSEVPFAFKLASGELMLPTNRAARFIDDGPAESMFQMVASVGERVDESADLPILPSLRGRDEARAQGLITRPLLASCDDADVPVIAYGTDSPTQFGLMMDSRTDDRDDVHARALANLATQTVQIQEITGGPYTLLVVTNSFFATEKLLDVAFMRTLHARLAAPMLAVTVPRRGLMFVVDAAPKDPAAAMSMLAHLTAKESATSRKISQAILLVQDGRVVGRVKLTAGTGDAPDEPLPPPAKRPGFFARLFGRAGNTPRN